jgi:hypothetical protein
VNYRESANVSWLFFAEAQAGRANGIDVFHAPEYSNNIEYRNQDSKDLAESKAKVRGIYQNYRKQNEATNGRAN